MKTYKIAARMYQRGRTNKLGAEEKRRAAEELGLRAVFAVCPRPDQDWEVILGPGAAYALPFADGKNIPPELDVLVSEAAARVTLGDTILVYCNAGRNRSSLFSALLLMRLYGWSGERVVAHMREVRPNALANEDFERYLLEKGAS